MTPAIHGIRQGSFADLSILASTNNVSPKSHLQAPPVSTPHAIVAPLYSPLDTLAAPQLPRLHPPSLTPTRALQLNCHGPPIVCSRRSANVVGKTSVHRHRLLKPDVPGCVGSDMTVDGKTVWVVPVPLFLCASGMDGPPITKPQPL